MMNRGRLKKIHTTLAPLATTSRSVGTDTRVNSTDPIRDGDRRAMSLLHSDASERKMDSEMRRELEQKISNLMINSLSFTHAFERMFPDLAFLHSSFKRFSSSLPILANLPG
jgi:hypothetical protein